MRNRLLLLAAMAIPLFASQSQRGNFELCRDALPGCDSSRLSVREREAVTAAISGRNFSACFYAVNTCEVMKLTPEQVTMVRDQREKVRIAAVLTSARNFSACAYGETACKPDELTADQINTLRLIAQQSLTRNLAFNQSHATATTANEEAGDAVGPDRSRAAATSTSRERWAKFGVGLLQALGAAADVYVRAQAQRAATQPIAIAGRGSVVMPASSAAAYMMGGGGPDVVETQIDGTFEGWTGETIFKLANGQIWQQSSYAYVYHYAYRPKVFVYRVSGGFRMQVDGVNTSIAVVRLQ